MQEDEAAAQAGTVEFLVGFGLHNHFYKFSDEKSQQNGDRGK